MFEHEGAERSDRLNRLAAGYLALIGGYVNSTGFVLAGRFTSHVTGNIGHAAFDAATGQASAGLHAFGLVASFFAGAFAAHLILANPRLPSVSERYGIALLVEAALLGAFATTDSHHTAFLSAAMGIQNSLVTRLSGAIVRTTHLTGVVTDLGIEAARWWYAWLRREPSERPPLAKSALLATIATAFTLGAIAGSAATVTIGHFAVGAPMLALLGAALFALRRRR